MFSLLDFLCALEDYFENPERPWSLGMRDRAGDANVFI